MKIMVHDYGGHPFTVELSRELATRGHEVTHAYFNEDAGPKGTMVQQDGDPGGLEFLPISLNEVYSKVNLIKRRSADIRYGRAVGGAISRIKPNVVISGNTPTEAQEHIVKACRKRGAAFVYWCLDFYSIAASGILGRKLPGLGHAIGAWYRFLERRQMRRSAHVVLITDAFRAQTDRWTIPSDRVSVIPNWGAINEIPVMAQDTDWAREQNLGKGPRFLYSGTLAMKHNPEFLLALAKEVAGHAEVCVVAAGVGMDRLVTEKLKRGLPALRLFPLQPFVNFAEVLGSADVLVAVIEREAGLYSVPSKVLSYLCAGRPIVLAAPKNNLAATIINETGAGLVVEPEDIDGFIAACLYFDSDRGAAIAAGKAGRIYAEENFVIGRITDNFEKSFQSWVVK
jgi:glycosyltransferase involved in cell wall biosynthesis